MSITIAIFLVLTPSFLNPSNSISATRASRQEQTGNASLSSSNADADAVMTEQEYSSKLRAADEETFKRDFETWFLLLMGSEQKREYEGLESLAEKKVYIHYYWKASNPNPLLRENDWLLEFNRRVQYSKKHFSRASPPYVDERAKYYIKYGEPNGRFVDSGGLVTFDDDFRIRYSTFPNETWTYENVQSNFVAYFVREGVSYRQVRSIYDAVMDLDRHVMRNVTGSNDPNVEYFIWRDMVEKRQHISPALARAVLPIPDFGVGSHVAALRVRADQLIFFNEVASYKAPPAARDVIHVGNNLKFFDRVAQFRGPAGKTRIDVALFVPLRKNLVKKIKKSLEDTLNVEFSGMLRDENFDPLIRNQSSSSLPVKLAAGEKLPNAIGKVSLLGKPQDAEITLQVEQKQRDKSGYDRRPLPIRDFSSRTELLLSDIQLNYRVKNDAQAEILPIVHHPDFLISPYPFHEIRKKVPPLVYFEIYNIQSANIGERLRISYTITPIKGKKASVNLSFTRPALSEMMHELVEIDLRNVKKGRNLLKVTVASLQDSTIQAVSEKEISVK